MAEATPRELKDYELVDGTKPFREWFQRLQVNDPVTAARITKYLDRIEMGNLSNAKLLLGCEGVWELVMDFGPGWRAYFAQEGPVILLLLCGGNKKSQKKDIKTAVQYWREFRQRNRGSL